MLKSDKVFRHELFQPLLPGTLIHIFSCAYERFLKAVEGLTETELTAYVIPGKWNILEIVIHTAHSEIFGAARMRQTITGSDSRFAFYDQDIWTVNLIRNNQLSSPDMHDYLLVFKYLRKTMVSLLSGVSSDDWNKTGFHPEAGEMTLRQLLELYTDHGERHMDQILERRRILAKEIQMEQILPFRLY